MSLSRPRERKWGFWLLLLFITVAGGAFRTVELSRESLWEDEIGTLHIAQKPFWDVVRMPQEFNEYHPPLYFVFLNLWMRIVPQSEFWLRFPSAAFGTISIFLLGLLARKWFGEEVGLLSALFLALSAYHVSYSQEARNYGLSMLLVLAALYSYRELLERPTRARGGLFVLANVALMYTNSLGLFLLVLQNIHFACVSFLGRRSSDRPSLLSWFGYQAMLGILFLPWIPRTFEQMALMKSGWWMTPPNLLSFLWVFPNYCGTLTSCHSTMDQDPTYGILLALLFGLFSAVSLFNIRSAHPAPSQAPLLERMRGCSFELQFDVTKEAFLLLGWFSFPIILPFVLSLVGTPIFAARSSMAVSLAFFVLSAKGMSVLPHTRLKQGSVFLAITLSILGLYQYYENPYKDHWREAAGYLEQKAQTGDLIIVSSARCAKSFQFYFHNDLVEIQPFPVSSSQISEETLRELFPKVLAHKKVWLLMSYHTFGDGNLPVKALMNAFSLMGGKEFFGLQLFEFGPRKKNMKVD